MRRLWLVMIIVFCAAAAHASVPYGKLIGRANFYYMMWHVYDVALYSPDGSFSFEKPFMLELAYKRNLSGVAIAERSVQEIRKLGFNDEAKLAEWLGQMKNIFPDVSDGVTLTGSFVPGKQAVFYKNNEKIGAITDPEFGRWFFGIWLNPKTSEPKLRKQLLGEK